ncbi:MAG: cytochrome c [Candidatus Omnitrophica bacterium]|nr:cytochrome c [Candidatus Omnitrophota bacterium]
MRNFLIGLLLVVVLVLSLAGFRGRTSRKPPREILPDMARQLKLRPQRASPIFPDGLGSRLPPAGTIASDEAYEDTPANTGRLTGSTNFIDLIPVLVTAELMVRGQERFQIYCLPCHSPVGDGKGIISKYGMIPAANYHDPRLVRMASGEIFNTITFGKNQMPSYASQVPRPDRWAIIAYIRALQRSWLATTNDVPEEDRSQLK